MNAHQRRVRRRRDARLDSARADFAEFFNSIPWAGRPAGAYLLAVLTYTETPK